MVSDVRIYSVNVNGIVTVVLPDFIFANFHLRTFFITAESNPATPVVEAAFLILITFPDGEIVNLKVTFPANPGLDLRNLL